MRKSDKLVNTDGKAAKPSMALVEVPVANTALTLLGPPDGKRLEDLTVEERVAMATRLNEVGPRLPRYQGGRKFLAGLKKDPAGLVPATGTEVIDGHTVATQSIETIEKETAMSTKNTAAKKSSKKPAKVAAKKPATGGHISADLQHKMKVVGDGAIKVAAKMLTQKAEKDAAKKKEAAAKAKDKKASKPADKKAGGKAADKGPKKPGIGALVRQLLKAKKTTEEILVAVKKEFPKAKTTPASIAWYRSDMKEAGELPKA